MNLDTFAHFVNGIVGDRVGKAQFCFLMTIPRCNKFEAAISVIECFVPRPPYTDFLRGEAIAPGQVAVWFYHDTLKIGVAAQLVNAGSNGSNSVTVYSVCNGTYSAPSRTLQLTGDRWEASFADAGKLIGLDLMLVVS